MLTWYPTGTSTCEVGGRDSVYSLVSCVTDSIEAIVHLRYVNSKQVKITMKEL